MVEEAYRKLKENDELKLKWQECFNSKDCEQRKELIQAILVSVIEGYLHMGTAQYLRDFRRNFEIKKSAELRKRVLQRQKKNQEKSDSVAFEEILKDHSPGKVSSPSVFYISWRSTVMQASLSVFIQRHS
ncbi:uncharacterized protein LOC141882238 [Acropora palmata]|uniref:uncharacterized protein LOC141882238 n=1 Tax=Acropora palmata TaxID=6131 RepID=UPI003DA1667F